MIKLWLDDVRDAPGEGWTVARTAKEAIRWLDTGEVSEASLDHDLGVEFGVRVSGLYVATEHEAPTGYDVAVHIERMAAEGRPIPHVIRCHSANPVGKQRIEAAVSSAMRAASL